LVKYGTTQRPDLVRAKLIALAEETSR
jgi:hypothetical protein